MQREIHYDEVFDAQRHYRILLDSMARPGKIYQLPVLELTPPPGIHRSSALIAFALLNADTCFHALGPKSDEVSHYLSLNTSSRPAAPVKADFVFIQGGLPVGKELEGLKIGSLPYPEESATLIVDTGRISSEPLAGALELTLKGPGVEGERKVYVKELDPSILQVLEQKNQEFPLGIDAIFTDADQYLFCIPRTTRIAVRAL